MELYKAGHKRIDVRILNQYPEFLEFHKARSTKEEEQDPSKETPEELLQKSREIFKNVSLVLEKGVVAGMLHLIAT